MRAGRGRRNGGAMSEGAARVGGMAARGSRGAKRQIGTPGGTPDKPAIFFRDAAEFGRWLAAHHDTETELWMGFFRKGHPEAGLTWEEAVREALCWGWIDSKAQGIDEHRRRQRWTPRKATSNWSTININAVAELTAQGRMQPSGLAAFEKRRADRSSIYTYENGEARLEPRYAEALAANPAATAFWAEATNGYRKLATAWVMTAKQEKTRDARAQQLVDDCAAGVMIKSQRYGVEPAWVKRAAAAAEAARAT